MIKISQALATFVLLSIMSCADKEEEIIVEKEVEVITSNLPDIRSARVKDDGYILVNGVMENTTFSFSLFNQKLKRVDQNYQPGFNTLDRVYHPYPGMLVIMKTGSNDTYATGTYISYNDGRSFSKDFTIEPKWGETWIGYLPLNENSYLMHGGSDWKSSTIVRIQDGVKVSEFDKVLDGYSILDGFYDQGIIHIIANEVTNIQPSDSENIYYFYSTDNGKTWEGKYYFGTLGKTDLRLQLIDANTLTLQKPFLSFNFISDDNGKSWRNQNLRTGLTDAHYINKSKGFGISMNTLYETTDGGAIWKAKQTLTHNAEYIFFLNETTGIVYSKDLIGYTQDGGLSWSYIVGQ